MIRAVWLGVVSLIVLVLVVCGGRGDEKNAAVDFPIIVYQGGEELGGSNPSLYQVLAQGKPIVLNFWGAFCPPCRTEMPDLQKMHDQFSDKVIIFGLDVGLYKGYGSREDGKELMEELSLSYPAGSTDMPDIVERYRLPGLPSTFFIKPDGEILTTWVGVIDEGSLEERIKQLIERSKDSW